MWKRLNRASSLLTCMEKLIDILRSTPHSTLVLKEANGDVSTFFGHGVKDLLTLLPTGRLRMASLADIVVGRGAAALMLLGGVKKVYAQTISEHALSLFRLYEGEVEVTYAHLVPAIENRTHTALCPIEQLSIGSCDIERIYEKILTFVKSKQ